MSEFDEEKVRQHIEKLHAANADKDTIPGIHNYCDRWCERCMFTRHCAVYKMTKDDEDDLDGNNKAFWERLALNFAAIRKMIEDSMERFDIDPEELKQNADAFRWEEREETDAEKLTRTYSDKITDWLKKNKETFHEIMLREGMENEAMVLAVDDAVEVLYWYADFIHVKTRRAMDTNDPFGLENEPFEERFYDNLGTAKIVLISIKRSMEALSFLMNYMPEQEDEILSLLVLLEKSQRKIKERWPTAMAFKRPGFDD